MAYLLDEIPARQLDNNGDPVPFALLSTFIAGTTTNLPTFTDEGGSIPLPNPIVADSQGFWPQIWVSEDSYDLVAKTPLGVTLWARYDVRSAQTAVLDFGTRLADTVNIANGAGMAGFGPSLAYLPLTVGFELAQVRKRQACVLDFIPVAEWAAIAAGSSTYNCTAAFIAAMAAARRVFVPAGTYLAATVVIPGNTELYGEGSTSIIKSLADASAQILYAQSPSASLAENIKNVHIHDLQLLGRVATAGFFEQYHLCRFSGITGWLIERVDFVGFRGDGLYIGSGDVGGLERHNHRVVVRNCLFDGVNNDNRNGISVIDGVNITIDGNEFVNCTRSNMPGSIDIEPNDLWNVVRNIKIVRNHIRKGGGQVGGIGVYLLDLAWTVPPSVFVIHDNVIDSDGYTADREKGVMVQHVGNATAARYPMALDVQNNTVIGTFYGMRLRGVRGAVVDSNDILETTAEIQLGFNTGSEKLLDVKIRDNYFFKLSTDNTNGGKGLTVFSAGFLEIASNQFVDCGRADGTLGVAIRFNTGTSNDVSLLFNTVTGTNTTIAVNTEAGHTYSPATNRFEGNGTGTLPVVFQAGFGSVAYNPPNLAAGATTSVTLSCPGARLGKRAECAFSLDLQGLILSPYVSAADTLTVQVRNQTAGAVDLGAGTLSGWVTV